MAAAVLVALQALVPPVSVGTVDSEGLVATMAALPGQSAVQVMKETGSLEQPVTLVKMAALVRKL